MLHTRDTLMSVNNKYVRDWIHFKDTAFTKFYIFHLFMHCAINPQNKQQFIHLSWTHHSWHAHISVTLSLLESYLIFHLQNGRQRVTDIDTYAKT